MELMNFGPIMSCIEANNFCYNIPPTVKKLSKTGNGDSSKRQKVGSKRVENPAMVEDWKIRPNESYDTVFKDKVKNGPVLSFGCKGCHKWHNKGFCFDDCSNVKSHKILKGDDFKSFDKYCKECRGE